MKHAFFIALSLLCGLPLGAQKFESMEDVNKVVDLTLDSLDKAATARPVAGSTRKGDNPVLFLVGNSTMRTGTLGNGDNGQWGWGRFAHEYFDGNKITVENQALGGTSSRTFYRRLWPAVKQGIRPGDWVIIELGHNDNGPFDSGRARATIKGISPTDSLEVTIKETGERETVFSYGEYLRRFVRETRALGAHPILMSLTPRHAYEKGSEGRVVRVDKSFGLWARQVADELGVPFIDLNEISALKYERMSPWKFGYHFYLDNIHTSAFGARLNCRSAVDGLLSCTHPEVQPLKAMMTNTALPTTGVQRREGRPVVFITGDSTVKNQDRDSTEGMWGWGSQAAQIFDTERITVQNCAQAGRSCRSYLREGRWDKVINDVQPGDFVTIQFGHNDICPITDAKARGVIPGTKDSLHVFKLDNGQYEVVYSFGWYLKKMIDDCREKGATPILVSLTPRNEWPGGKIERRDDSYGKWYREVVAETGVEFIDMHNISADFLDKKFAVKSLPADKDKAKAEVAKIKEKAGTYFKKDHTHASKLGAQMNAQSFAKGLRAANSALAQYLKTRK